MQTNLSFGNLSQRVPNIFDGIADKAFNMVVVRKTWSDERPTAEELEEMDEAVADLYGFALRIGGGLEESVPQYAVGYVLPKGKTIRLNQQNIVQRIEKGCSYFDEEPFVTMTPVMLTEEQIQRATLVGTPPSEALSGLKEFKDDFEEEF